MTNPYRYQVGQRYHPDRDRWPDGVAQYNYRQGQHELVLFFARPTSAEVLDARRGPAEFALLVDSPVIVLLYRFGASIQWSDAPYSWHMVPADQQTIPDTTGMQEPRAVMTVMLVDAADGILRSIRVVSLSPALTAALHLSIRAQAATPWVGQAVYDQRLADIYRRYPRTSDMLRDAVARSAGGTQ